MIGRVKRNFKDNMQYKVVAFIVALVLWVVMLGRKDITLTREIPIQALIPPHHQVTSDLPTKVQVEVAGPRIALKKFSAAQDFYMLDMEGLSAGDHRIKLTKEGLNLPLGTRLLSIRPQEVEANIKPMPDSPADKKEER